MSTDSINRRRLIKTLGAGSALTLAGCSGGETTTEDTSDDDESGGDTTTQGDGGGEAANVAMVYPVAGLGDQGFSDNAQQGLMQAEDELGISYQEGEPGSASEYSTFHNRFASSQNPDYDLIIGLTFAQATPIKQVAANFPDQKWTIIDSVVGDMDNVASVAFREHEGSYVAGTLAGYIAQNGFESDTVSAPGNGVVGFVGGTRNPIIQRFEAGFRAGVKAFDESIDIRGSYIGAFNAPSKGQSAAQSMFDNGADIVYHAAGGTGLGMFDAAQDAGRPAIGVDTDQSVTAPDYSDVIVASMIKRMDRAVYTTIENVVEGDWKGSTTERLGLEEKAHELVYGQEIGGAVSQEAKDAVSTARQQIIDGEVTPPEKPE